MIYPETIILEVTNYCNIRCRYCHFHGIKAHRKRSLGFIKQDLWEKVISEIGSWQKNITLMTHGAGEPLLYKDLSLLLKFAKKYKNIFLGFMCNGTLFNKSWSDFVLDIGIDWLAFSVDGTDPKKHSYYRKGTDLNLIEKNIFYLLDKKQKYKLKKPYIMLNMVVYPDMEQNKKLFVNKWINYVDKVMLSNVS